MSTAYDFEIAVRDIQPGEQLTDDYGYLNIAEPFEVVDEGTERKIVYPDDILRYHEQWDNQIKENYANIAMAEQPLLKFVPQHLWSEFTDAMSGKTELKSLLTCYHDRAKESV